MSVVPDPARRTSVPLAEEVDDALPELVVSDEPEVELSPVVLDEPSAVELFSTDDDADVSVLEPSPLLSVPVDDEPSLLLSVETLVPEDERVSLDDPDDGPDPEVADVDPFDDPPLVLGWLEEEPPPGELLLVLPEGVLPEAPELVLTPVEPLLPLGTDDAPPDVDTPLEPPGVELSRGIDPAELLPPVEPLVRPLADGEVAKVVDMPVDAPSGPASPSADVELPLEQPTPPPTQTTARTTRAPTDPQRLTIRTSDLSGHRR
jgi:hypothetical protein